MSLVTHIRMAHTHTHTQNRDSSRIWMDLNFVFTNIPFKIFLRFQIYLTWRRCQMWNFCGDFFWISKTYKNYLMTFVEFKTVLLGFELRMRRRHDDAVAHCNTTHCDTLQNTVTHCNTLQHTATHCNTLQRNCCVG